MKKSAANNLVMRCAGLAAKAPRVSAYVIVYTDNNGAMTFHKDGGDMAQIGMMTILRDGIVNNWRQTPAQEEEDEE